MIAITIQFETNPKATWRDRSCKNGRSDIQLEGSWQEPPPMCAPKALMHAEKLGFLTVLPSPSNFAA